MTKVDYCAIRRNISIVSVLAINGILLCPISFAKVAISLQHFWTHVLRWNHSGAGGGFVLLVLVGKAKKEQEGGVEQEEEEEEEEEKFQQRDEEK